MGRRHRKGRPVNGILLLDKPSGATSNAVLQRTKRLFGAAKAGHTGSLDPLATGLLPLCFGEATKVSAFLLDADKTYRFRVRLGVETDSGDADGAVIADRPVADIDRATVETVLRGLRGRQEQVPPMHSAVKQGGQPLYKLAHQGETVERVARPVDIHTLELLAIEGEELDLRVHCSKGTYVRVIAEKIGEALGCGGHISALRRTGVGPYDDEELVTPQRLETVAAESGASALDRFLQPVDSALRTWPAVHVGVVLSDYLRQGQAVQVPGAPSAGLLRLYDEQDGFIGMGQVLDDGRVGPKRLMNS